VRAAQEMLDTLAINMKARTEKMQMANILGECKDRAKEVEDAVAKAREAEEPFLMEELPEDAAGALTTLENAFQTAQGLINSSKTFLAMKKLNAKRLAEGVAKSAQEEIATLQKEVDVQSKKLQEVRKGVQDRKMGIVRTEVAAKMEVVEKAVQAATVQTMSLSGVPEDDDSATMKDACEKVKAAQTEAQSSVDAAREVVLQRQREAKSGGANSAAQNEFTSYLDKLAETQSSLDAQKSTLKDSEHRFVAKQLIKETQETVEELEQKFEETAKACSPLTSGSEDFISTVFLAHIIDALRAHVEKAGGFMSLDDLFQKIKGDDDAISEARFIEFLLPLPELKSQEGFDFGEDELRSVHKLMCKNGTSKVDAEAFSSQFAMRYLVAATVAITDAMVIKTGKTVRKLQANEIVEALGEPAKEETTGMSRVKARALKDGTVGYVTVSGNQGTVYLAPHSTMSCMRMQIDGKLKEMQDELNKITSYLDTKLQGMKDVRKTGPLSDAKNAIMDARPRVQKVDGALKRLHKDVQDAEKNQDQAMEVAKKKQKEVADRRAVTTMMDQINEKANELQLDVERVVPAAEDIVKSASAAAGNPLQVIDNASSDLTATLEAIEKVQEKVKANIERIRQLKGPDTLAARSSLMKLRVKFGSFDAKCKKQVAALQAARRQVTATAHVDVMAVLTDHVQKKSIASDSLLQELGKGTDGPDVPLEAMRKYIEKIPGSKLKALQLDLALERYSGGITKLMLLDMVQEYQKCVKEIAITSACEVKLSKTVRKLELGEIIQVLESSKAESSAGGLHRVRGRALSDLAEGWISVKGNQGTYFLSKVPKPYYYAEAEVSLQSEFPSGSSEVSRVLPGEVLEALEGPRKEPKLEVFRIRCKAKDGTSGWLTQRIGSNEPMVEAIKAFVCKASTALTETFDVGEGKAIRKVEVGEEMELLEEAKEDPARKLMRMKGRCKSDGKEGWMTMTGTQGTDFLVEEPSKFSICKVALPMELRMAPGSKVVRELEQGEQVEVIEGPKTQSKEGATRVRGRNLSSGVEGWFDMDAKWQQWQPLYRCVVSTSLSDQLDPSSAQVLRDLVPGETLEALETPALNPHSGSLAVRLRAESDGATGFATIREEDTLYLEPGMRV
jgi:hypothetical protein